MTQAFGLLSPHDKRLEMMRRCSTAVAFIALSAIGLLLVSVARRRCQGRLATA